VAACGSPVHADEFRNWLGERGHGEMSYMERAEEKRCDPQKVLPGAKSIVVLALNYFQGTPHPPSQSFGVASRAAATAKSGRIARYAWGDDYHELIESKLDKIDEFLREFGGQQKCYVDTGPVLERDYAAQAGIGWHGKSTMLIDERLGTWFFLAEVLTTLELPPDKPVPNRCGTCERCIKACPTGAITAPHRLDARRCISYLTIELKGSIPLELRPLIGDRIFGCDDCLDACPWNRFALVSREAAFYVRPSTVGVPLRDYLSLSDDEFRVLFRNSPIKRVKRRGFLRNVCVALGNVGDPSDLAALEGARADPEPLIAEHARWASHQIRSRHRISQSG
jgi:epoxyqueuosine reductase